MENKRYLQKCYLNDQEQHLALGVPTSEMAHAEGGERKHLQNDIKPKPEHLKLNKTDPST
jgi:hypothetical protein